MADNNINYLLVNSCNEYLEEYTPIEENARFKITGFSGSTGDALISKDKIYLFVDGRYHEQADQEVDKNIVTVVKMQMGETLFYHLAKILSEKDKLGVMSKKVSQARLEILQKICSIKLLNYTGTEKFAEFDKPKEIKTSSKIAKTLRQNEAILVSNLEEISYLLNVRDFSIPYSSLRSLPC